MMKNENGINNNSDISPAMAVFLWSVHFDSPYASSENYYQSVNAFYKLSGIEGNHKLEPGSKVFY